jgi:hypothetical protein
MTTARHEEEPTNYAETPRRGNNYREMEKRETFKNFKERGEWVELRFMTQAIEYGFKVSKPWGDCSSYDVGVESNSRVIRVQVKSTTCRTGSGYLCQFKPNYLTEPYKLSQIDFFAAYVIPQDVWYLIPARVLISGIRKEAIMVCPMRPLRKNRYRYERFREAWKLLCPRLRKSPSKSKRSEPTSAPTPQPRSGGR